MKLSALLAGTAAALLAGTAAGQILRATTRSPKGRLTVSNMNARIAAWWVLCGLTALALFLGDIAVFTLFAMFSSLGLREFLRIIPAGPKPLIPCVAFTLLHYFLVWRWWPEGLSPLIPLASLFFLAIWNLGEIRGYLQRTAEAWWGLMMITGCLSYAPALLRLQIPSYEGRNATLLFYFLLVVQSSDVLQYLCGKLFGRRPLAPVISPHKTWEGLAGGMVLAIALGAALYRATPFRPLQAAGICAITLLAGVAGGLSMSALKRDRGLKDFGALIPGHGGVLDRIDSLCFSAPVFFHCVRHFYTA